MEQVLSLVAYVTAHWVDILAAVLGGLNAAIAIALIVPGDQPEKFLQSVVDFLSKFSKK